MTDYIVWDGTVECLEELLIWWGEHGGTEYSKEALLAAAGPTHRDEGFPLEFTPDMGKADSFRIQVGDHIRWREFTGFYHLPNPGILEFDDPEDYFPIKGRCMMYTSSKWKLPEGWWEPWDMTGLTVKLCGVDVKLVGVEAFCSARSPSSPYHHSFALGISPEDAERVEEARS